MSKIILTVVNLIVAFVVSSSVGDTTKVKSSRIVQNKIDSSRDTKIESKLPRENPTKVESPEEKQNESKLPREKQIKVKSPQTESKKVRSPIYKPHVNTDTDDHLISKYKSLEYFWPGDYIYRNFLPTKYTCDGDNISPPITIGGLPENCESVAIICDCPDALVGTFVHWVIFNITPYLELLPENVENVLWPDIGQYGSDIQPIQGINDYGVIGYVGPCPPNDRTRRYYFRRYFLDIVLEFDEAEIKQGIRKDMLLEVMEGHIITRSDIVWLYSKK